MMSVGAVAIEIDINKLIQAKFSRWDEQFDWIWGIKEKSKKKIYQ